MRPDPPWTLADVAGGGGMLASSPRKRGLTPRPPPSSAGTTTSRWSSELHVSEALWLRVGELGPLPPGSYLVTAKLMVGPPTAGWPQNRPVECVLRAEDPGGAHWDVTRVMTDGDDISYAAVVLRVVHQAHLPGRATLRCRMVGPGTSLKRVSWVKMMAVKVNSLQQNIPLHSEFSTDQ